MNKIKNVGNYTISVLTDFHWTKNTMKVNGNQKCLVIKIFSIVFSRRKKGIKVCNALRVSTWLHHFHLWV